MLDSEENNINNNDLLSWDFLKWIKDFKASQSTSQSRKLRTQIFKNTIEIVKNNQYFVDKKLIKLNENDSENNIVLKTVFYEYTNNLTLNKDKKYDTEISVINADCIEVANLIRKLGYNPAVLNMASRHCPGGGVLNGAGAQEENIFRRSNLFLSLYQYIDDAKKYNIERNPNHSYPINEESGGIYSPDITVFRSSEQTGYYLLNEPFKISFISVPAIKNPEIQFKNNRYELTESLIELTKLKIRTILRIALINNHDSLVLSAFGCGAYRNPAEHMSLLFKEVLLEEDFHHLFKVIVFAILDDHNSWHENNPEGNLIPFQREFECE